jgi:hypothetical protein
MLKTKHIPRSHRPAAFHHFRRVYHPKAMGMEIVNPSFLDQYTNLMCVPSHPCEPIIPEYYNQIAILHKMNLIMLQNDISGFETQVFRLLLVNDVDTLDKLLESIKSYHSAVYNIEIISKLVGLNTQ